LWQTPKNGGVTFITEKEYESGTPELAKEVTKEVGKKSAVVLKNHGFVTVGKTLKQAGDLALAYPEPKQNRKLAQQTPFYRIHYFVESNF
jgi:hypothetical protein